jgi:peptide/nickel transport system permease protein
LLLVGAVVFVLLQIVPGDPAAVMLGGEAYPEDIERLRRDLGLDAPIYVQLARWYLRLGRADFGDSLFLQVPVSEAIWTRLEPTLELTLVGSLVAVGLGLPLGVLSAAKAGTWVDDLLMSVALLGVSVPAFWLGIGLILLFSVTLGWLPSTGYVPLSEGPSSTLRYLLMPAVALGYTQSGLIARTVRAAVLDVLGEDYVRTARAKGLHPRSVLWKHVLKNAMVPTITIIGVSFAIMLGGSVVLESIFNIPGIGNLLITAVLRRDYPIVQGGVFFIAAIYVLVNLVVDLTYVLFDPRVRYG